MGTDVASPVVREAITRATGFEVRSLTVRRRPPMPHQANRLYDVWAAGRHLIAKEFLSDVERNGPSNEYRSLHLVQRLEIAPRPVFFDPSAGPVVVYQFMDGDMWDRRVASALEPRQIANADRLPRRELELREVLEAGCKAQPPIDHPACAGDPHRQS